MEPMYVQIIHLCICALTAASVFDGENDGPGHKQEMEMEI